MKILTLVLKDCTECPYFEERAIAHRRIFVCKNLKTATGEKMLLHSPSMKELVLRCPLPEKK